MKVFKCEFIGLFKEYGMDDIRAVVMMHEDHDHLGAAKGGRSITSTLKFIDFERGILLTRNNVYDFSK